MKFQNIIGQEEVKKHLLELVEHNRLSHALLFLGKEGSGTLPLAIAFAQFISLLPSARKSLVSTENNSLFGEEPKPVQNALPLTPAEADAWMQKQAAYSKTSELVHPDIHFSYPVIPRKSGDKPVSSDYISEWREFLKLNPYGNAFDWLQFIGAENKQGNITSQECGDIIRKLSLKTFESEYKVLVMWLPEYLGNEGNKLLKLIEEPPENTVFILVAENESLILPTILSRTQLIKVPPLSNEEIRIGLEQKANIPSEQASQLAALAEGNYREALQLIKHSEEDWQGLLRTWLNAIMKNTIPAQVKWIDEASKLGRERQKQFLRYFNHLLEQAIRLQSIGEGRVSIPEYEKDFALRLNKIASFAQQQQIIRELDNAIYYVERNANAKLLFHALTIKIYHIIVNKQVIEVV